MKLHDILTMWENDAKIATNNLGREAAEVPMLHAKYITLMADARLSLRKAETGLLSFRRLKERYYRGELSKEELDSYGWEQYLYNKPLKSQIDEFLAADEEYVKHEEKVEYLRTRLTILESIIKSISNRTWDIKNAIEYTKWESGG
jgi:hypothetical protein